MADHTASGGPHAPASVDAPQLTLVNVFPTPLVIATLADAETLNAELKRTILAQETANASVQRSNHGGRQSTWDLHEWGGAPVQKLLAGRTVAESPRLVPRAGMLVVFLSWLSHGARPYRGTRERISIAVNFSVGAD
jgi:hypothetical protein